ncbi:MAG: hypothetical protein ACRCSF_10785 [Mycobacteriaceae bacterium]
MIGWEPGSWQSELAIAVRRVIGTSRTINYGQPTVRKAAVIAGNRLSGVSSLAQFLVKNIGNLEIIEESALSEGQIPTSVVFVVDSASPLGRADLEILERAAGSVSAVFCVLTKIDIHQNWRTILERNKQLLASHAPGFSHVRWFAVSSKLAQIAISETSGKSAVVAQASGMSELVTALEGVVIDDEIAYRSYQYHQLRTQVDSAIEVLKTATANAVNESQIADLTARKNFLLRRRSGKGNEQSSLLRNEIQLARVELVHYARNRIRSVSGEAREDISQAQRKDLRGFTVAVRANSFALIQEIDSEVTRRVVEIGGKVLGQAGESGKSARVSTVPEVPEPEAGKRNIEDTLVVVLGASGGIGLGKVLSTPFSAVPGLEIATLPASLVLGAGVAIWMIRARRLIAQRTRLARWAADTYADIRAHVEQDVLARLLEAEAALGNSLIHISEQRGRYVAQEIAEIDAQLRVVSGEKVQKLRIQERERTQLSQGRSRIDAELARLNAESAG